MQLVHDYIIPAPLDAVADTLTSPRFATAAEAARRDTVVTSHFVPGEGGRFELRSIEYDRGTYGRIDRNKKLDTTTRCQWLAGEHTLRWVYEGVGSDIMRVSGETRLSPVPQGTRVEATVDVDVTVPLVGRIVERAVSKAFRRGFVSEQNLLLRHLGEGLREVA